MEKVEPLYSAVGRVFLRKGPGAEEAELRVMELGYDLSGRNWNEECQDLRRAIWRR